MYESSIYAKGETKHSESTEDAIFFSELSPSQEKSFDLTRFITDCNSPSPLNLLSTDPRLPDSALEASDRLEGHILAAVVTTAGADQPFPEVGVSLARTSQSYGDSSFMPMYEFLQGGEDMGSSGNFAATGTAVATVGQPWSDIADLIKSESSCSYAQLSPANSQAHTATCSTVDSSALRPPASVSPHFGMISPSLSISSDASAQQTSADYPTSGETRGRRSRTTSTGSGGKSRSSRKRQLEKGTPEYHEKRARNNVAVRKSRLKSKQKQNETETRVQELVTENEQLHKKVDLLTKELTVLKGLFVNVGAPLPADLTSLLDS